MTREYAAECLDEIEGAYQIYDHNYYGQADVPIDPDDAEALKFAIAMLKAEPCADCISRQAVYDMLDGMLDDKNDDKRYQMVSLDYVAEEIAELPSVTPAQRMGRWIDTNVYIPTAYSNMEYVKCSCCGEDSLEEGDFCPNCGADMKEGDA